MDVPLFHLDGMGNHMLIAVIAMVHVVINYPMAVGAYPLISLFEYLGMRRQDEQWDQLAKKITFVTFLISTTLGLLSGIGIGLSSALVAPFGFGSLLRMFFWSWLLEWSILVIEVILILAYYMTWDRWQGRSKRWHLMLGCALSVLSWGSMAMITLGFPMSVNSGTADHSIFGALSPLHIAQLSFLTVFAMASAGIYVWFLIAWLVSRQDPLRYIAIRIAALWTLAFGPLCMLTAWWFWLRIPTEAAANISAGLMSAKFAAWQSQFLLVAGAVLAVMLLVAMVGWTRPRAMPRLGLVLVFLLSIGLLERFERAGQFVRKPFLIEGYMYSNGVRVDQLALFQSEGILPNSTYSNIGPITDENRIEAGKHVFLLTCTRCHTTCGLNGVVGSFESLYGKDPWSVKQIESFLANMHVTRPYMPPFPGNLEEAAAISAYLCDLQKSRQPLSGAQSSGIAEFVKRPEATGRVPASPASDSSQPLASAQRIQP